MNLIQQIDQHGESQTQILYYFKELTWLPVETLFLVPEEDLPCMF